VKYFFDTNIIIDLLNNNEDTKKKLKAIISEEGSELFINRLVLTEALRTIDFKASNKFKKSEIKLDLFQKVDIKTEIYDEAIRFSRFCHSKGVKLKGKCEAIDFLHFITAKYYNLNIVTNDKAFDKLEKEYIEFTSV
jgi:predicted nucleic acid-binding protein